MKRRPRYSDEPPSPFSGIKTSDPLFGLGGSPDDRHEGVPASTRAAMASMESRGGRKGREVDPQAIQGVYIISVAARILEMHPQTLRKYERVGLITPSRTVGMLRLYSEEDIARLRLIKHLVGELGLNLAGVQLTLEVFNHLLKVRSRVNVVEPGDLRRFVADSLDETFEVLHAHLG